MFVTPSNRRYVNPTRRRKQMARSLDGAVPDRVPPNAEDRPGWISRRPTQFLPDDWPVADRDDRQIRSGVLQGRCRLHGPV